MAIIKFEIESVDKIGHWNCRFKAEDNKVWLNYNIWINEFSHNLLRCLNPPLKKTVFAPSGWKIWLELI